MSIGSSTIAIVTGGSRGIGFATASALVARGVSVGITGTDEPRLEDARVALSGADGARVLALRADVRVQVEVARAVTRVVTTWGGLDILVNNAGVGGFVEVSEMTVSRLAPRHRHQPHRCLPLLPRGASAPQGTRRRLDHQRQQPGRQQRLRGRRRLLRVEGRAECVQRVPDAGSTASRHSCKHRGSRVRFGPASAPGDGPGTDWKLAPDDVAQVIVDPIDHPARSLPSRVEIRPSLPPRK